MRTLGAARRIRRILWPSRASRYHRHVCAIAATTGEQRWAPVYEITTEDRHTLVSFALSGAIDVDETARFVDELRWALARYEGRRLKLLADLRAFKPTSSSVAELMQRLQQHALSVGVVRIAEITSSRHLAVQMAIVSKRSGAAGITRRFETLESAKDWLLELPPEPSSSDPSSPPSG